MHIVVNTTNHIILCKQLFIYFCKTSVTAINTYCKMNS